MIDNGQLNAILKKDDPDQLAELLTKVKISEVFDDIDDWSPVTLAAFYGSNKCMKYLIEYIKTECSNDNSSLKKYLNAKGKKGGIPLIYAVEMNRFQCVRMLLDAGADPNICDDLEQSLHYTPVHIACSKDNVEILKLLIQFGGKYDFRSRRTGSTPLFVAVMKNAIQCAEYLILLGAKVNDRTVEDDTPLHYAQFFNTGLECTKLLLEHGADVNAKNDWGETPLHRAAKNCNDKAIELLLSYGADINVQSKRNGNTPLHYAIPISSDNDDDYDYDHALDVLSLLLDHHPELEIKNWDGETPLFIAVSKSNPEFVSALLEHGADVNTTGKCGMSVLEYVIYLYETEYLRWGGCFYPDLCDAIYDYVDDEGKRRIDAVRQQGEK